jgi:hypothetical protein
MPSQRTKRSFRLAAAVAATALYAVPGCGTDDDVVRDAGRDADVRDAQPPEDADVRDAAPDALVPDAEVLDAAPDAFVDAMVPDITCADPVVPAPTGGHNPETDCMTCHIAGGPAASLVWTAAGTVFDGPASTTPVGGATVHLIDEEDHRVDLVTHENGTFFTAEPFTGNVKVYVSMCPDIKEMIAPVTIPASCNSCHGASFRVNL